MERKVIVRRLAMAAGTFLCAWAIGFFMQSTAHVGSNPESSSSAEQTSVSDGPEALTAPPEGARLFNPVSRPKQMTASLFSEQSGIALSWMSAEAKPSRDGPAHLVAPHPVAPRLAPLLPVGDITSRTVLLGSESDCAVRLTARKSLAAMARLKLDANCLPNTAFTVHHSGMMFSDVTDEQGSWEMDVPALVENARFIVSFDSGFSAVSSVLIDTVAIYDRYVLQWQGRSGLEMHVLESGASHGEAGHVWAGAARDSSAAVHGVGGFVTILGSVGSGSERDGRAAQVYTVASLSDPAMRGTRIHAEAAIHEANCGRDVSAEVLVQNARTGFSTRDLVFAMPDCTAVGELVVLESLADATPLIAARNQ